MRSPPARAEMRATGSTTAPVETLAIRARAEMRLAEEYDAAQERGEVAGTSRSCVGTDNAPATAADLGLRRDEIHDWRKLRDAEAAEPGLVARALDGMLERGGGGDVRNFRTSGGNV